MAAKEGVTKLNITEFLQDYLFPTLSVIILVLVLSFLTIPTIGKINESADVIKSKKEEVENLEQFLDKLSELSETQSTTVADNLVVDKYLPKDSRISSFIDEINYLAVSAGLKTTELSGSETIQKEEITTDEEGIERPRRVLVTFNYVGSFDDVYRLFEEINGFKSILSVRSVAFSRRRVDWSVEITVSSYNLPQEVLARIVDDILEMKGSRRIESVDEVTLGLIKQKV